MGGDRSASVLHIKSTEELSTESSKSTCPSELSDALEFLPTQDKNLFIFKILEEDVDLNFVQGLLNLRKDLHNLKDSDFVSISPEKEVFIQKLESLLKIEVDRTLGREVYRKFLTDAFQFFCKSVVEGFDPQKLLTRSTELSRAIDLLTANPTFLLAIAKYRIKLEKNRASKGIIKPKSRPTKELKECDLLSDANQVFGNITRPQVSAPIPESDLREETLGEIKSLDLSHHDLSQL